MGSNATFVIASGIGLYPIMGEARYWLSPPRFRESLLTVGMEDSLLRITTAGADPASSDPTYIQDVTLDGEPVLSCFLDHHALIGPSGKERHLEVVLSHSRTSWGSDQ